MPSKNIPTSRRAKNSILEPTVQLASTLLHIKNNGFNSQHGHLTISTSYTCPFDAVYAVVAALYADEPGINKQIEQLASNSPFLEMIRGTFTSDKTLIQKYNSLMKARNLFLRDYFQIDTVSKDLVDIDCNGNVNLVIPKVSIRYTQT